MTDLINKAIDLGGVLYSNVSGGKDGQAMTKILLNNGYRIEGLVHADLGRAEWKESITQCQKQSKLTGLPLHVVIRNDGLDLVGLWERRMNKLKGQGIPFWSSADSRYCTSDMKRAVINVFYTSTGHNLIISCEGIRAEESTARAKKVPLSIRMGTSTFYKGMSVEEALVNYRPDKRLCLTWFPVFNLTLDEVWATYGMTYVNLHEARQFYSQTNTSPDWWPFHPAYVYGNNRVSCAFCVLANENDLRVGAKHNPELLQTLIGFENQSGFTFKHKWSLKQLL